jgi:hypothetical protein
MKKLITTSIALASAASLAQGAAIHAGLLNYWDLDSNTSDSASSYAGATGTTVNDGTVNGNVSFVASPLGSAASFPGGAGNNVTVADPTAGTDDIDRSGADLSISVWFQLSNRDTNWQGLVAHGEGTDYRIALRGGNDPIQIAYAGGGAGSDIFTANNIGAAPGGDGLWHHIVATTEGSTTNLYMDGVLEASGGTGPINENGQNTLCIGCNPTNGREWNGLIDDVGMWDRALSLAEVQEIYNAGQSGISLGAIPEPGTASLLGLIGGLALLRRRR